MNEHLRFAEAVCEGHPDRLADRIAERIVDLACGRDDHALVGVEVAIHRNVVFIDGRIAAGTGHACAVDEQEIAELARAVFRDAGYGASASGTFVPVPDRLDVRMDLCLGPLEDDERAVRHVSDDQAIAVGHAVQGARAGYRPLEQALATDCASAIEALRRSSPSLGLGPDGKVLIVVRGRALVGVSVSVHHAPGAEWIALTRAVRDACETVAAEYVAGRRARAAARRRLADQRRRRVRDRRTRGRQRPQRQEARRAGVWIRRADRRRRDVREGSAEGGSARPADGAGDGARVGQERQGARGDRVAGVAPWRCRAAVGRGDDRACGSENRVC